MGEEGGVGWREGGREREIERGLCWENGIASPTKHFQKSTYEVITSKINIKYYVLPSLIKVLYTLLIVRNISIPRK